MLVFAPINCRRHVLVDRRQTRHGSHCQHKPDCFRTQANHYLRQSSWKHRTPPVSLFDSMYYLKSSHACSRSLLEFGQINAVVQRRRNLNFILSHTAARINLFAGQIIDVKLVLALLRHIEPHHSRSTFNSQSVFQLTTHDSRLTTRDSRLSSIPLVQVPVTLRE